MVHNSTQQTTTGDDNDIDILPNLRIGNNNFPIHPQFIVLALCGTWSIPWQLCPIDNRNNETKVR